MATTSQGIISGAATGAATGSIAGPWGAAIGGIVGGALGGFSTSAQNSADKKRNDAIKEQAILSYNNTLDYATDNFQQQKYLINRQNDELKQQADTKINNRALSTLQERGNLRNSLVSNNIGGNVSKRLNSVSALTGATDIGIIEKNLSNNLFNQELKKEQAKNQYLDTIKQGEINTNNTINGIVKSGQSDILGTVNSVAQGALGTYSGLKSFGTFDTKSLNINTNNTNVAGTTQTDAFTNSNNFDLQGGYNDSFKGSLNNSTIGKTNPFNLELNSFNNIDNSNSNFDLQGGYLDSLTKDANVFNNSTTGFNSDYKLEESKLYKTETFDSMQKDIIKMDNIIVKNNVNSNIQLINFKENYTNKDTTGINKIDAPKIKKEKVKTYNYNNNNFLYIK